MKLNKIYTTILLLLVVIPVGAMGTGSISAQDAIRAENYFNIANSPFFSLLPVLWGFELFGVRIGEQGYETHNPDILNYGSVLSVSSNMHIKKVEWLIDGNTVKSERNVIDSSFMIPDTYPSTKDSKGNIAMNKAGKRYHEIRVVFDERVESWLI